MSSSPAPERVRGIVDLPITPEGRREISTWAKWFKDRGGLDLVYHSDLVRDQETAKILAKANRATLVELGPSLRPQNQGVLQGQLKESAEGRQHGFLMQSFRRVPGGESLDEFKAKFLPTFFDLLRIAKHAKVALVSHGSNMQLANAWLSAGAKASLEINPLALGVKIPSCCVSFLDPADFLSVPPFFLTQANLAPLTNGLYSIRHGRTAWSS